MTTPVRRVRHSSSGPFLNNPGSDAPPVPIGEGSPGLVWRFQGNATPQAFTDVDPTQDFLFAGGDDQPDLTPNFEGPGWLDFELYLSFAQWGTATVDCKLQFQYSAVPISTKRIWDTVNAGNREFQGIMFSDRMLYTAAAGPSRFLRSFKVILTVEDDTAVDNIIDSPNSYAKFTQYVAPPTD